MHPSMNQVSGHSPDQFGPRDGAYTPDIKGGSGHDADSPGDQLLHAMAATVSYEPTKPSQFTMSPSPQKSPEDILGDLDQFDQDELEQELAYAEAAERTQAIRLKLQRKKKSLSQQGSECGSNAGGTAPSKRKDPSSPSPDKSGKVPRSPRGTSPRSPGPASEMPPASEAGTEQARGSQAGASSVTTVPLSVGNLLRNRVANGGDLTNPDNIILIWNLLMTQQRHLVQLFEIIMMLPCRDMQRIC